MIPALNINGLQTKIFYFSFFLNIKIYSVAAVIVIKVVSLLFCSICLDYVKSAKHFVEHHFTMQVLSTELLLFFVIKALSLLFFFFTWFTFFPTHSILVLNFLFLILDFGFTCLYIK